jgi:molybdopterin-guanine dinucleotide biosynthesis protein A
MLTMKNIAGVVLAGGKNSRYNGFDKSFLVKGKATFIEHTISTFREIFHEIIIITNQPETYNFIDAIKSSDLIKDIGPLGGIYTALKVTTQPAVFVVSCDMPYLDHTMIKRLAMEFDSSEHDILMPCIDGDIEPLHAVYSSNILHAIEQNVKNNKFAIRDIFPHVRVKYFELESTPSNKKYFTNVNSPEDFEQLRLEMSIVERGYLNM